MKKSLFWSLMAATAMMTACSDDATITPQVPEVQGEEVPVAFAVNVGNPIGTYATTSDLGGWSNFQKDKDADAGMKSQYDRRAIIQVFKSDANSAFLTEQRRLIADDVEGNTINMENIRLQPNATYKAVVWVDFVANDATDAKTDLYYNTANLSAVSMIGGSDVTLDKSPEGRDAYTATVTFTVTPEGKYTINGEKPDPDEIATAIPMIATRPFGKVRLVLTDYATKAEWVPVFDNTNANSGRALANIKLAVTDLCTTYNALAGTVTTATQNSSFSRAFTPGVTDIANWAAVNNVTWEKYTSADGTVRDCPVLDFNYFLPNTAESYALGITALDNTTPADGATTNIIKSTTLSTIPVKKNCLTTIYGNFLTYGYNFAVTVKDEFDNVDEALEVKDDGTLASRTETLTVGADADGKNGATVVLTKNTTDGTITDVEIQGLTADNQDAVTAYLGKHSTHDNAKLSISAASFKDNALSLSTVAYPSINVTLTAELQNDATLTFNSKDVQIKSDVKQTKDLTLNNTNTSEGVITIASGTYEGNVKSDANTLTLAEGTVFPTNGGKSVSLTRSTAQTLKIKTINHANTACAVATSVSVNNLHTLDISALSSVSGAQGCYSSEPTGEGNKWAKKVTEVVQQPG